MMIFQRRSWITIIKGAVDMESGYSYIDDITWDDLEMDDVFLRINHTDSFAGEQILYHKSCMMYRRPAIRKNLKKRRPSF